ncbi:hypothetical protein [Fictibacillus gelatini]|uniref:hypothetical protein n=1 Tax=Fictibacillus gelatini TaxID=225985 RepID=UPI0005559B30|nr:hypothetical protein [Fictibacillus gelatini]
MNVLDRKRYYVNVESGEIHPDKTASGFEFEIEATDRDVIELKKLFDECDRSATKTFWRAHVPFLEYHNDQSNDEYDEAMKKIYKMIHDLGQPETREHIESMGILD